MGVLDVLNVSSSQSQMEVPVFFTVLPLWMLLITEYAFSALHDKSERVGLTYYQGSLRCSQRVVKPESNASAGIFHCSSIVDTSHYRQHLRRAARQVGTSRTHGESLMFSMCRRATIEWECRYFSLFFPRGCKLCLHPSQLPFPNSRLSDCGKS